VVVSDLPEVRGSGRKVAAALTDNQLCAVLQSQLSLDAQPALAKSGGGGGVGGRVAADPTSGTGRSSGTKGSGAAQPGAAGGRHHHDHHQHQQLNVELDAWVRRMLECVELERDADIAAANEATAMCSAETAQVRRLHCGPAAPPDIHWSYGTSTPDSLLHFALCPCLPMAGVLVVMQLLEPLPFMGLLCFLHDGP
jgi:hypothetical protein